MSNKISSKLVSFSISSPSHPDSFKMLKVWVVDNFIKGELHSNYILLNWPRIGFYNPTYKNQLFFSSKTHISTSFAQDIYSLLFTNINIF